MSGRFVRASKYRHVFGRPTRREQCYDNLRISKNAWDTNLVKANPKYLAVNWEASGGGAFAVIPLEEKGKLPEQIPLFRGHTATVLDTDWNPFNDSIIASGSDDGKVFLWEVPRDFTLFTDADEPADVKPVGKLSGHSRKVGHVLFNPAAENVLASSSGDYTVKLWDLEDGKSKLTLKHNDIVQSLSWSANGDMLVTTSRDKKLRFWDVRQEKPAHEVAGHAGAKNSRCVWMGDLDRVATTGFSKMSERQLGLWDIRNPEKPVGGDFTLLDSSSGVAMPFWDDGCHILYIAGKGDGNIRYYEYENDKFESLSEYKSAEPQRGLAFMPKRGVNTHETEIMRAFKTVNDSHIEPISFIVPRKSESFQEDIYPPTVGTKAGTSSAEWLSGNSALPPKFSMEDLYDGKVPTQVAVSATTARSAPPPEPVAAPSPVKAPEPKPEPPAPAPVAAPSGSAVAGTKLSMSNLASKFADKGEADNDDDSSSFEEIENPQQRLGAVSSGRAAPKTDMTSPANEPVIERAPPATASSLPAASSISEKPPAAIPVEPAKEEALPAASSVVSSAAGGLRDVLQDIKALLQSQGRQIEQLTSEVAELKAKVGSP
ncbi:putative actin-binding protein [Neohortaea acidophila]|uniref:Coronin n=1 Tax=Neohortaea acidophila TaxID=245834 RepID=A0A6A6PPX8_9PEZI|nr:putative actin-binding protein [Neohortaea acidophila]KAF2481684.1 putative actin-binding protein [Neohortaea acidophila]